MENTKTRTCRGCGGSGETGCAACRFSGWLNDEQTELCGCPPCSACQGFGRVVEPDSKERIRQALEDAETLRDMARQVLWRTSSRLSCLKLAASKGSQAHSWAEGPFNPGASYRVGAARYAGFEPEVIAQFLAKDAARAAFRAVPGLRG